MTLDQHKRRGTERAFDKSFKSNMKLKCFFVRQKLFLFDIHFKGCCQRELLKNISSQFQPFNQWLRLFYRQPNLQQVDRIDKTNKRKNKNKTKQQVIEIDQSRRNGKWISVGIRKRRENLTYVMTLSHDISRNHSRKPGTVKSSLVRLTLLRACRSIFKADMTASIFFEHKRAFSYKLRV